MTVLCVKTDQEAAELLLYSEGKVMAEQRWQAHRELTTTIFTKINELFTTISMRLDDVSGIVGFEGPGSFTGLRIGLVTANTLAYTLGIPIVAAGGNNWVADGVEALKAGRDQKILLPFYGSEAHITAPKR